MSRDQRPPLSQLLCFLQHLGWDFPHSQPQQVRQFLSHAERPPGLGRVSPSITGGWQVLAQRKPTQRWLHFQRAFNAQTRHSEENPTMHSLERAVNNKWKNFEKKEELTTPERTHRGTSRYPDNTSCRRPSGNVCAETQQEKHTPLTTHTHSEVWNRACCDCLTTGRQHLCLSHS